jgi:hypothetical protein
MIKIITVVRRKRGMNLDAFTSSWRISINLSSNCDPGTRSSVKGMSTILPLSAPRESEQGEVENELA